MTVGSLRAFLGSLPDGYDGCEVELVTPGRRHALRLILAPSYTEVVQGVARLELHSGERLDEAPPSVLAALADWVGIV